MITPRNAQQRPDQSAATHVFFNCLPFLTFRRDVITPQNAPKVLREEPNPSYENFVAGSVGLGQRAHVAAATMVGLWFFSQTFKASLASFVAGGGRAAWGWGGGRTSRQPPWQVCAACVLG